MKLGGNEKGGRRREGWTTIVRACRVEIATDARWTNVWNSVENTKRKGMEEEEPSGQMMDNGSHRGGGKAGSADSS